MTLGEQIKKAREQKNISQEELADRLSVSRQAVSKWENDLSVPHGVNRDMLAQELELELATNSEASKRYRAAMYTGWIVAAVLLVFVIALCVQVRQMHRWSDNEEKLTTEKETEEAAFRRVRFFDGQMNEVFNEALWYDGAQIKWILVQWTGGGANSIKMLYTPSGSDTLDQTELLLIKSIPDGDQVILLSAESMKKVVQGHVFFQLDFGEHAITSETYNVFH